MPVKHDTMVWHGEMNLHGRMQTLISSGTPEAQQGYCCTLWHAPTVGHASSSGGLALSLYHRTPAAMYRGITLSPTADPWDALLGQP